MISFREFKINGIESFSKNNTSKHMDKIYFEKRYKLIPMILTKKNTFYPSDMIFYSFY